MTTRQVAERLESLCRAGQFVAAIRELYASDVRQSENGHPLGVGREQLAQACQAWLDGRVLHGMELTGIHVAGDSFVLELRYDVTPHATKERVQWCEAGVYSVTDGRISDVRFYYKPPVG